ncbi:hypothetical protein BDV95DRAFT_325322 [Massariosphaeria phaeospora]|uniref:F-box domain-containing protein n=1 Tax=Massariosphaeria phaeospora TaxID=100035 RepID=A0A7C8IJ78_9PLEO|nr:hypothetical protein BDV95DRAFT_325322 [Massariosphaeria phaeospora]
MVTFDTLPHEILLDVFEIVRDTDFESFLSIPLTCSRFFHVAQPLLYRHISFSLDWDFPYSLPKFATPLANKEWVRSISVKGFRYNRRRTCSMLVAGPIIEYDYESVYRLLSSLDRLETFSLQLDHDQEYRSDLFPTAVLQRLLQRLPKSVVNLELDTNGCDDMWEHGHICPTIREILPQLEVLRLRVSQLCDDLVGRSPKDDSGQLSCVYPRLRIAVVPLYFSFRELDRFEESDEHILECARPHASESDEHQLDPTIFANRLRNIYTAARFPRLQYFLLLEEHVSVWTREFAYSSYRVRNIKVILRTSSISLLELMNRSTKQGPRP